MKSILLLILLCLSFAPVADAQSSNVKQGVDPTGGTGSPAKLQLTTSIVSKQYCHDGNSARLYLTLRLNFTNVGHEPILIDKSSSVYDKSMISRNLKDAADGKYEDESIFNINLGKSGIRMNTLPDESFFLTLKPGESHSTETEFRPSLYDGAQSSEDDLRAGAHVLQLRVWTWYYLVPADQYRQQWRGKGYLWSKNVTSLPMPFTVDYKPVLSKCS